ncbi:MAG: transposase domain-containing protein [Christensenellales bacterium]|jgi:transposase
MSTFGGIKYVVVSAEAGAVIYSLAETAKENGLDPYRYLTCLMREAPKLDMGTEEQVA